MKNKFLIYVLLLVCFSINVQAQVGLDKLAQSTMNFLLVSTSPKASGMGDAFFAVGTGAESIFYNPSAIVETDKTFNVVVNYTRWIADINYLAGAATWNMQNYGTIGFSILTVDYGTLHGTRLIPLGQEVLYPSGYIDTGELSNVGAYAFGLSYAKSVSEQFLVGGNIKIAGQNLSVNYFDDGTSKKNNAAKLVFDLGVKYYTGFKNFRFGMAIRNFASNIKREEIAEQLPLTFTLGAAIDLMDFVNDEHDPSTALTFAADFLHSNNYTERVNLGLEYKFLGAFALRGGYQTNRDVASWSAGFGLNSSIGNNDFEVNYSYSKMDIFDDINRLSVGFSF